MPYQPTQKEQNFFLDVIEVSQVASHMRRVKFQAKDLLAQTPVTNSSPISCWFPDEYDEYMRSYTIVNIDRDNATLDMYFLLHPGQGPATNWARNVKVGDELYVTYYGSKGFQLPSPAPKGILFIADGAGVAYVNAAAEMVPEDMGLKIILVRHNPQDDDLPTVRSSIWVDANQLEEELAGNDWSDWAADIICEAGVAQQARKILSEKLPRERLHLHAYWTICGSMGTSK